MVLRNLLVSLIAVSFVFSAMLPASAQQSGRSSRAERNAPTTPPPGPTPLPAIIEPQAEATQRLMDRLGELENQMRELAKQNDALRVDVDRLTRENGALTRRVDALSTEVSETKNRLAAAEAAQAAAPNANAPAPDGDPAAAEAAAKQAALDLPADPVEIFKRGQQFLIDEDYGKAETAFRAVIKDHPKSAPASDAHYWLGETLFVQGAFPEAAKEYLAIVRANPSAAQTAQAMVRLAASFNRLNDSERACAVLDDFAERFPNAPPVAKTRAESERRAGKC